MNSVVVVLSDRKYFKRAEYTLDEIRDPNKGDWKKDIVFISVDFDLEPSFIEKYSIIEKKFPRIDISELQSKLSNKGYLNSDGRELNKISQWEKIHLFDDYFRMWDRVIYFDVGFRIYDKIEYLEDVDCKDSFIAPNDSGYHNDRNGKYKNRLLLNLFDTKTYEEDFERFIKENDFDDWKKEYFCNCIFMFDTQILDKIQKTEMIYYINRYALWLVNEMTLMNFFIIIKYNIYKELPSRNKNNKYLYAWSEVELPNTSFNDYCYVKYSNNPDHLMWNT